jgi:uncharacterized protein (TIGR00290 family)
LPEDVLMAWSGGKDSALALYTLQQRADVRVVALLTTVTEGYDRVSMHGVRRALLEQQAVALGLPLHVVTIPQQASMESYGTRMEAALRGWQAQGVSACAFGDIFLEDVRAYREANLARIGMKALFPLWGRDTQELAEWFLAWGFQAVVTCVDSQQLDPTFAGRHLDADFLAALPPTVDPCGENGEFHSFVFAGPLFRRPVTWVAGEIVVRDAYFHFCDLLPPDADR